MKNEAVEVQLMRRPHQQHHFLKIVAKKYEDKYKEESGEEAKDEELWTSWLSSSEKNPAEKETYRRKELCTLTGRSNSSSSETKEGRDEEEGNVTKT